MIDLSSNENPFPPSQKVVDASIAGLEQLNRYVGYEKMRKLRKLIAEYCDTDEERIIVGPGTNWINREIACRLGTGKDVVVLNPGFSNFLSSVKYIARKIVKIQLTPPEFKMNWGVCLDSSCLIFIDSPNNPTGQCLIDKKQLVTLLEEKHFVIVDEAGFEYSGKTFVNLVKGYPNLAITRTFDKAFGLAGFRMSWMIAGNAFLKRLLPEDSLVTRPGCAAAIAALEEKGHMQKNVQIVLSERDFLKENLKKLDIEVFDSEANYLLVRTNIADFALRLRNTGILIEDFSQAWVEGYYRITVGKRQENLAFIHAIQNEIDSDKDGLW